MKQYHPAYYKNFKCTADKCSDNCCIGWEIDIDENSLCKYKKLDGEFGKYLNENITVSDGAHCFALKNERCAFLNENNLCEIYINMGEDALCEICTQHPRYHEWYGEVKESGVGLCCEAACRLIFGSDKIAEFEWAEIDEQADDFEEKEWYDAMFVARQKAFDIVKKNCIYHLPSFGAKLQRAMDDNDLDKIYEISANFFTVSEWDIGKSDKLKSLIDFLSGLEPIDPEYPALLQKIKNNHYNFSAKLPKLMQAYPDYLKNSKQLGCYFLYRYFCKSVFDGDVFSKTVLAVIACNVVTLLALEIFDRKDSFCIEDFVFAAKQFSKEIEYSIDNLEAVYDYIWDNFLMIE